MSLQKDQVVRMAGSLWRVDYVNECRARVVPLAKRHVIMTDGREFDAERGGVNISPNSPLEVVTDVERTKLEMELEEAERETAQLRRSLAQQETDRQALVEAEQELVALRAEVALEPAKGSGWHLLTTPETKPGSLKASVVAFLQAHPGATTKQVAVAGATPGAVAACLDRFMKAGVIKRG